MTKKEKLLSLFYEIIRPEKREKFDRIAANRTRHVAIVVENIYQEHNASAVVRSCDCFGFQDVHIIEKTNRFELNREISMGSAKWINHMHYYDPKFPTKKCINSLKKQGYKIIATTPHEENRTLNDLPIDQPIALLFGTEKNGLSELALSEADEHVKIPMYGFTESFNISVSAALSMQILREKLEKSNGLDWLLSNEEQIQLKIDWCKNIVNKSEAVEREFIKKIEASANL
jgi:tRNA (guanosine-2'-O-)-methyltransferase